MMENLFGNERENFLYDIHQGTWDERVYSPPFLKVFQTILDPGEREVVRMRVSGLVAGEIAIKLNIKLCTVKRKLNLICQKFRLEENPRVDNSKELRWATDKYTVRPKKRKIK